jgi:hypothetical protein
MINIEFASVLIIGQMNNYKTFAVPFSKVFLGAVLTYQIIYWTWLKLETDEIKFEKNGTLTRSQAPYRSVC